MKENEKKSLFKQIWIILLKIIMAISTVIAFYKIPGIIANKMAYRDMMKKTYEQKFTDEEK